MPDSSPSLLIDERLDDEGAVRRTHLQRVQLVQPVPDPTPDLAAGQGDHRPGIAPVVVIRQDGDVLGALPVSVLAAVMVRYGRPLDPDIEILPSTGPGPSHLDLGDDRRLETLRFRARVDASSRDYLVWRAPGQPALAALSRTVAGALRHLACSLPRQPGPGRGSGSG